MIFVLVSSSSSHVAYSSSQISIEHAPPYSTLNTHPMVTRFKNIIYKPKIYIVALIDRSLFEPTNTK